MSSMPVASLHEEVLIALSSEPLRFSEIVAIVELAVGREISSGSITRSLERAIERGAAVKTEEGYREPLDALSDWGAGS